MAKMHQMTSMEMDDEDKIDACMPMPCERADYPYGLRLSLTEKELEKLNLDDDEAEAGGLIHGHFMGRITSVSREDREGKKSCRVEIQIEDLSIEAESEEDKEAEVEMGEKDSSEEPAPKRRVLYG